MSRSGRRILVLTDRLIARWPARLAEHGDVHWLILPLGYSHARYVAANTGQFAELSYEIAPLACHVTAAEHSLRSFYPAFLREWPRRQVGGTTLLEILHRHDAANLWWFTGACEKSPLRGPLLTHLFRLALLDEVLRSHVVEELWIESADPEFRRCVSEGCARRGLRVVIVPAESRGRVADWIRTGPGPVPVLRLLFWQAAVATQALLGAIVLRVAGIRRPKRSEHRPVAFFTRYPILWKADGAAAQEERYFHHLDNALEGEVRRVYLALMTDSPLQLWRRRARLVDAAGGRMLPLLLWLTPADLVRALLTPSVLVSYRRFARRIAPETSIEFCGFDIGPLWGAELQRSLTGAELQQNLLLERIVRRAAAAVRPRAVFNPLEFQPMERALWAGCAAVGGILRIGIQHSTFCGNHLMYYFAPGELRDYQSDAATSDPSPLPDVCLVAGPRPALIMKNNGMPAADVQICGAIRYNDLRLEYPDAGHTTEVRQRLGIPLECRVLLVLTSQARDESTDLIETLALAAPSLSGDWMMLFRSHYHCRMEQIVTARLGDVAGAPPHRMLDVNGPLHDYIRAADAVLVGGTTAALEALALGRPPLVYANPSMLNLSPLADYSGAAVRFVAGPEEIVVALAEIAETGHAAPLAGRDAILADLFDTLDGRAHGRVSDELRRRGVIDDPSGAGAMTRPANCGDRRSGSVVGGVHQEPV